MRFQIPVLLGFTAAASASTWIVEAFTETNCKGERMPWSGDEPVSQNTGNWYASIVAQYDSDWTFTAWTGALETGDEAQPATNTCQNTANETAILSFTMAKS